MNNIKKKDSREILYFRYIFGNHWDSKITQNSKQRIQYGGAI